MGIEALLSFAVILFQFQVDADTGVPKGDALPVNNRPVVGILAQEFFPQKQNGTPNNGSYIAASYVKVVESSGARVVPIMIGQDQQYYENLVNWLNGIILPGGGADLWIEGGYGEAAKTIYDLVIKKNQKGELFPLLGVCLGFEMLAVASGNMNKSVLEKMEESVETPLPLKFEPNFKKSSLYNETPDKILEILSTQDVTPNHHGFCVTKDSLETNNLTSVWKVLSTSSVPEKTFVSTMEHSEFPSIFGVQFHPEKIAFEWNQPKDPHNLEALIVNRWFYDYAVELARKNHNQFPDPEVEKSNLIYNYAPTYMDSYFMQIYKFQEGSHLPGFNMKSVKEAE